MLRATTVSIRAEVPGERKNEPATRYEQTLTVPQLLDVDKLTATHRHGMLQLALPLKEHVKPRRVQVAVEGQPQKQLVA